MEKQISIIIPTYNMEAYIGKCLDSLLIPNFNQVEVIVVNDGSNDQSSKIAHRYADRFPDSIRVIDKSNGNYGSCINAALPICTGKYIKVLDADDTFDTAAFTEFVNMLISCEEDVIMTNYVEVDLNGSVTNFNGNEFKIPHDKALPLEMLCSALDGGYLQMHKLAYRKEVFNKFEYKQIEGISYTDTQWAIIPLAYCSTFKWLDIPVYRYLVGREGQTMNQTQLTKSLNQLFKLMAGIVSEYQKIDLTHGRKVIARNLIRNRHQFVYSLVLRNSSPDLMKTLREYDLQLKENSPELYNDINTLQYSPEIHYHVFKHMREKNYPVQIALPLRYKIELSFKIRIKRLFK